MNPTPTPPAGQPKEDSNDSAVRPVYIRVLLFEAAIIVALWFFGRRFL
jgi:hypothetical protein